MTRGRVPWTAERALVAAVCGLLVLGLLAWLPDGNIWDASPAALVPALVVQMLVLLVRGKKG